VTWHDRLREAVRRSGMKHSVIALDAGIAPETLSRVLSATHARPAFETVVRIAHASGHTVGWLLSERGYSLSPDQVRDLRRAAEIIERATGQVGTK
jgi:transcriptional regulator with XRE-family HTH domain